MTFFAYAISDQPPARTWVFAVPKDNAAAEAFYGQIGAALESGRREEMARRLGAPEMRQHAYTQSGDMSRAASLGFPSVFDSPDGKPCCAVAVVPGQMVAASPHQDVLVFTDGGADGGASFVQYARDAEGAVQIAVQGRALGDVVVLRDGDVAAAANAVRAQARDSLSAIDQHVSGHGCSAHGCGDRDAEVARAQAASAGAARTIIAQHARL